MKLLEQSRLYLASLDTRTLHRIMGAFIACVMMLSSGFVYHYYAKTSFLRKELARIMRQREMVQTLLGRYEIVEQHKRIVEDIVAKDPRFKLTSYLNDTLKKLSLTRYATDKPVGITSPEELRLEGYKEASIEIALRGINTKQLVDFLTEIENNNRVYTKRLEVTQQNTGSTIDSAVVIGTLLPATEPS